MSIPPHFDFYVQATLEKVRLLQNSLTQLKELQDPNPKITKKALSQLKEIDDNLSHFGEGNLGKRVDQLQDQLGNFTEVYDNLKSTYQKINKLVVQDRCYLTFHRQMEGLLYVHDEREKIENGDFEEFWGCEWAQNEFHELVACKNPWALEFLKQKVGEQSSVAALILWQNAFDQPELLELLKQNLEKPFVLEAFSFFFEIDEEHGIANPFDFDLIERVYKTFTELLKNAGEKINPYIEQIISFLDKGHFDRTFDLIKKLILSKVPLPVQLYQHIEKELLQSDYNFLELLETILNKIRRPEQLDCPLVRYLNTRSKESDAICVLMIGIPYACAIKSDNEVLYKNLADELKSSPKKYALFERLTDEAAVFNDWMNQIAVDTTDDFRFNWNTFGPYYRNTLIFQFLDRKRRLIEILESNEPEKQIDLENPFTSEDFRKPQAFFIGDHPDASAFLKEFAKKAKEEGFEVMVPCKSSDKGRIKQLSSHFSTQVVKSPFSIEPWLRDFFSQTEKYFQFASPSDNLQAFDFGIKADRQKRGVKESVHLNVHEQGAMGTSKMNLNAFVYLELLKKDNKPLHKKHRFMLTYQEGGNMVRVNLPEKEPKIVIGRDTLALNKVLLAEEFTQLGLRRIGDSWQLDEPYHDKWIRPDLKGTEKEKTAQYLEASERNIKLVDGFDENLVITLMAYDLGVKPEQIIFVEQPAYHLDIAMTQAEDGTLLLHDSMKSHELMLEYLNEQKIESSEVIEARLKENLEIAQAMKPIEDQVEKDLIANGLKVARVPGVLKEIDRAVPDNHQTNFFNMVKYRNAEDKNKVFAMGSHSFFQRKMLELFKPFFPTSDFSFADEKACKRLLIDCGGLHCLMQPLFKNEGEG